MNSYETLRAAVAASPARSAWSKGVRDYALDIINNLEEWNAPITEAAALNGAESWKQYAWGGCGLVYDEAIATALCSPSELKRCKGGQLQPNSREKWLDVEARALFQAWKLIERLKA